MAPTPQFSPGVLAARSFFVSINVSAGGNNTIVAAVPGKNIIVLLYVVVCAATVALTWESSGGLILDGPCNFLDHSGISVPMSTNGHFQTVKGEGLILNLSSPVQVGGHLVYALSHN